MDSHRLEGLDLLRGLAALCVMLLHLPLAYDLPDWPLQKAYLSVDLFFMLSGYVLARTYHARLTRGITAPQFMLKRVRRLWSVVAIGLCVGFLSQIGWRPAGESLVFLAMGFAFIPFLWGTAVFPLNGAIWSIFFELFANLIHATLFARLGRSTVLTIAVLMALVMFASSSALGTFDLGAWGPNFRYGFPRVLLSYALGCWLSLVVKDRPPFAVRWWVAPASFISLLLAGWALAGEWLFDFIFVVAACPLILVASLTGAGSVNKVGAFLGDLSFPLYAIHVPIIYIVADLHIHWLMVIPIALAGALVVAAVTGSPVRGLAISTRHREPASEAHTKARRGATG